MDNESFHPDDQESEELFEHFRIQVDKGQSLLRIDKFLVNRLENTSRNRIQSAAVAGNIRVNNKPVKSNYKVKPLDQISIVLTTPPREIELYGEDIPLEIIYEDEELIVLNKNAGMVVHPAYGNYSGTLINALIHHLHPSLKGPLMTENERPGLVHRIDKNTSGLLVIAKTEEALTKLAHQFYYRTIQRHYIALVWGNVKEEEGTIDAHVGRSMKDRKMMDVFEDGEYGKHAITHYRVLERFGYTTLVSCKLETGRTHQIRVHMKHLGHPIFNDETYGGDKVIRGTRFTKYKQFVQNCFTLIPRQALHAASLGFTHPSTNKSLYFESALPKDFDAVIEKWRNYSTFEE